MTMEDWTKLRPGDLIKTINGTTIFLVQHRYGGHSAIVATPVYQDFTTEKPWDYPGILGEPSFYEYYGSTLGS